MKDLDGEDEDFGALLAEYEQSGGHVPKRRGPQAGDAVRGRVVSIGREAVLLDVGAKSEGVIALEEVLDADGKPTVEVGQELDVRVVRVDARAGHLVLRYRLGRAAIGRDELSEACESGVPVEGTVSGVVKGGVEVQVAGVRAFCPISRLDERRVEDGKEFVGRRLTFRITRCEPGPRGRAPNVVLDRRGILEEESKARAAEARARLEVGAVVHGRVTTLQDYGAFVDLGGIEGMLHVSEIGFAHLDRPGDVLSVGQEVEVQILRIEATGNARRPDRIALSLKSLQRDPWEDVPSRFPPGARASGRTMRVESFGAFVELAPGIEGLLHVGELAQGRQVRHAREVARVGQTIEVVVREIEPERHRIRLGLADVEEESGRAVLAARGGAEVDDGRRDKLGDLLAGSVDTPPPASVDGTPPPVAADEPGVRPPEAGEDGPKRRIVP